MDGHRPSNRLIVFVLVGGFATGVFLSGITFGGCSIWPHDGPPPVTDGFDAMARGLIVFVAGPIGGAFAFAVLYASYRYRNSE